MVTATTLQPQRDRIESLDALRGVAVLGIFMVNVQAFAMTPYAYQNPTVEGDFAAQGQAAWTVVAAFFQYKFITIFSALFGAGIILMAGEGGDPERDRLHVRRMLWLLLIGGLHAYLLWFGDILVPYALAGLVLIGARSWPARPLAVMGLALTAVTGLVYAALISAWGALPPEAYAAQVAEHWAPPPDVVAERAALFRASFVERWPAVARLVADFEVNQIIGFGPRVVGVMMIGMALQKLGFFAGRWSVGAYAGLALLAPAGAGVSWMAARALIASDFDPLASLAPQLTLMAASLAQALGYAALVILACRPAVLRLARTPFAAAGRMALTNYLGCSIVGAFVFYGPPGLGRIGALTRLEQIAFALAVWAVILVASPLWLRLFAFGPFEWIWRSLTYGRLQPLRRRG